MNMYGTSAPRKPSMQQPTSSTETTVTNHDTILRNEELRVQEEKQYQEEWNQFASEMKKSMDGTENCDITASA